MRPTSMSRMLLLLSGVVLLAACSSGDTAPAGRLADDYASTAQRNLLLVADAHAESLRVHQRPLTYAETLALAEPQGIRVVIGASREENVVSTQLEYAAPGTLPFAVVDGDDCIILLLRYPTEQTATVEVSSFWVLVQDYVRNLDVLPSAACVADAVQDMDWENIPLSADPTAPALLG